MVVHAGGRRSGSAHATAFAAEDPLREAIAGWADDHPEVIEAPSVQILKAVGYSDQLKDQGLRHKAANALTALGWRRTAGLTRYWLPDGTRMDKSYGCAAQNWGHQLPRRTRHDAADRLRPGGAHRWKVVSVAMTPGMSPVQILCTAMVSPLCGDMGTSISKNRKGDVGRNSTGAYARRSIHLPRMETMPPCPSPFTPGIRHGSQPNPISQW